MEEDRPVKTLHLVRHAKSSWREAGVEDHDRDLNERGRRDAPAMGEALSAFLDPQPVYCSSALRARRTLQGLCEGFPALGAQPQHVDGRLYSFDYRDLLAWLRDLRPDAAQCLLLGHNPALTDLCNQLVGRPALDNLPTAGYLQLGLAVDRWEDIAEGCGELLRWLFPRNLC